jgi:hypothetical protein
VWGLAAGAALGNPLNAIEAMGFGGIVLSGDRCNDSFLARQLGVKTDNWWDSSAPGLF